jgi:hypothetical protein
MTDPPCFKCNKGEKRIFASLQFNGYANSVRKMGGLIYHTSIIVVLLDRRDIKIWYPVKERTIVANMAE